MKKRIILFLSVQDGLNRCPLVGFLLIFNSMSYSLAKAGISNLLHCSPMGRASSIGTGL